MAPRAQCPKSEARCKALGRCPDLDPGDGKMRSLGMVEPGTSKAMPMPKDLATLVAEGAQLAVSVEAPGGSTKPDGPEGPVAAQGKLAKI